MAAIHGNQAQIDATMMRARMLQEPRQVVYANAGHGVEYDPPVPVPRTAKQQYDDQKHSTKDAYLRLKGVLAWLTDHIGDEVDSPRYRKLEYISMHVSEWESIAVFLASLISYCEERELTGDSGSLDDLYRSLTTWLKNIETTYQDLIGRQDIWFVQKFHEAQTWMAQNTRATAVISALVMGACVGGTVLHKYRQAWCVVSTCVKFVANFGRLGAAGGASAVCTAPGWLAPVLGGAFLGVLVLGAVYGIYRVCTRGKNIDLKEAERQKFADIDRMVKAVKAQLQREGLDGVANTIHRLAAKYDERNNFHPDRDSHVCPVCLEDMVESDLQPVRFGGCQGRHFHCFECWGTCTRYGFMQCSECRC